MAKLRIAVGPSFMLGLWLCVVHLVAVVALWLAALPLWLKAASTLVIAGSLAWPLLGRAALRGSDAIVALEVSEGERLSYRTRRGEWRACELLASSYVSPRLTILNLKPEGARFARHVVLVPDNVAPRDFRQLRIWLRWAARPEAHRAR
jgi:hypothetical protein